MVIHLLKISYSNWQPLNGPFLWTIVAFLSIIWLKGRDWNMTGVYKHSFKDTLKENLGMAVYN